MRLVVPASEPEVAWPWLNTRRPSPVHSGVHGRSPAAASTAVSTAPVSTSTSRSENVPPATPLKEMAIFRPSGEKRGPRPATPSKRATSRGEPPSLAATTRDIAAVFPGAAGCERRKAIRCPSGDQVASPASSTTRRASPPRRGTRKTEAREPANRVKSTVEPSGENCGKSSDGPSVSATSVPVASCFSQMRARPSRSERKATERPSGEASGE